MPPGASRSRAAWKNCCVYSAATPDPRVRGLGHDHVVAGRRQKHVGPPVACNQSGAWIIERLAVLVLEEPRSLDDLGRQLDHVDGAHRVTEGGSHCHPAPQADDSHPPRRFVQPATAGAQAPSGSPCRMRSTRRPFHRCRVRSCRPGVSPRPCPTVPPCNRGAIPQSVRYRARPRRSGRRTCTRRSRGASDPTGPRGATHRRPRQPATHIRTVPQASSRSQAAGRSQRSPEPPCLRPAWPRGPTTERAESQPSGIRRRRPRY
jgi:hypothetical protein